MESLSLETTNLFSDLIRYHDECLIAQFEGPYDGDRVQGLGMRFAAEWNRLKFEILEALDEPEFVIDSKGKQEENFTYTKWRAWVPRLRDK